MAKPASLSSKLVSRTARGNRKHEKSGPKIEAHMSWKGSTEVFGRLDNREVCSAGHGCTTARSPHSLTRTLLVFIKRGATFCIRNGNGRLQRRDWGAPFRDEGTKTERYRADAPLAQQTVAHCTSLLERGVKTLSCAHMMIPSTESISAALVTPVSSARASMLSVR